MRILRYIGGLFKEAFKAGPQDELDIDPLYACVICGEPGYPTCGAVTCIRAWRFREIEAGRPDPLYDPTEEWI